MPPKKKKHGRSKSPVRAVKKEIPIVLPPIPSAKTNALMYTVCQGDALEVNKLVTHYNYAESLNTVDVNGSTALHLAVRKGDEKMVEQLLAFPQSASTINRCEKRGVGGYTALHIAAKEGHVNIVSILIKRGAMINAKADSILAETALHLACKHGNAACAKMILSLGGKPDVRDGFGHNASFWASQAGHDMMIKELGLPPVRTATAQEFVAILMEQTKARGFKFVVPTAKGKKEGGKGKGKGKKGGKKK